MNTATSPIRVGLPPGPKGTLIGGNIRQFRDRLLDFLLQVARDYGPLTSFRVGPRRIFLASASELIEQVLTTLPSGCSNPGSLGRQFASMTSLVR